MLANLPRCTMSLDAETAEQLHHVMIMFWRRIADAKDPVKQIGVGAIEQRFESPELVTVQGPEGVFGERAEDEVALLRPAMPAPKQEAPAADIRMFVICGLGRDVSHLYSRCHCEPLLRRSSVLHLQIHQLCRRHHVVEILFVTHVEPLDFALATNRIG
jgi:hypothetical protein